MHRNLVPPKPVSVSLLLRLRVPRFRFRMERVKHVLSKPFWIPPWTSTNSMETSINLNRVPLQRKTPQSPKSCRTWWTKSRVRVGDRENVSRMCLMLGSQSVLLRVALVPKPDSIRLEIPFVDLPYRKRSECSDSLGIRTSRMSQLKKLVSTSATALW